MDETPRSNIYLLPLEKAAVIVKGEKSTTDIAKEVRFCLGEDEARTFYTDGRKKTGGRLGWAQQPNDCFDKQIPYISGLDARVLCSDSQAT